MKKKYILSLACLLISSNASAQNQHDTVSDDGTVIPYEAAKQASAEAASLRFSTPFSVSGNTGQEISGEELAERLKHEGAIPEFFGSTQGLKPLEVNNGQETVIGVDTRGMIDAASYGSHPYPAVGLLAFSAGTCTGWLISPDTVITAGHCVHSGGSRGSWYPTESYKFYPARNGESQPYGYCTAKSIRSVTGWTVSGSELYDYGTVKLDCTVGNLTGWFGYRWTSATSMNGDVAIVTGYPGDKPAGTQWIAADKIRATTAGQLFYPADTIGGMSGSPVWNDWFVGLPPVSKGAYAIAIHAYGLHGSLPHSRYNHGTRIVKAVFDNFNLWRNL